MEISIAKTGTDEVGCGKDNTSLNKLLILY